MRDANHLPTASATGGHIVFFDGVCVLCNGAVRFIRRRDRAGVFRFATLGGPGATRFLASLGAPATAAGSAPTTVFLVTNYGTPAQRLYSQSTAALKIARLLPWPWRALVIGYVVPRGVRDWAYQFIAKRRYRWFGELPTCPLPTAAERATEMRDDEFSAGDATGDTSTNSVT